MTAVDLLGSTIADVVLGEETATNGVVSRPAFVFKTYFSDLRVRTVNQELLLAVGPRGRLLSDSPYTRWPDALSRNELPTR